MKIIKALESTSKFREVIRFDLIVRDLDSVCEILSLIVIDNIIKKIPNLETLLYLKFM
jgi:hypothetical protein